MLHARLADENAACARLARICRSEDVQAYADFCRNNIDALLAGHYESAQHSLSGFNRLFPSCSEVDRTKDNVLQHRVLEDLVVGVLEDVADSGRALAHGHSVNVPAVHRDRSSARTEMAAQAARQCRLAAAVLADDPHHRTGWNLQVDAINRQRASRRWVPIAEPFYANSRPARFVSRPLALDRLGPDAAQERGGVVRIRRQRRNSHAAAAQPGAQLYQLRQRHIGCGESLKVTIQLVSGRVQLDGAVVEQHHTVYQRPDLLKLRFDQEDRVTALGQGLNSAQNLLSADGIKL